MLPPREEFELYYTSTLETCLHHGWGQNLVLPAPILAIELTVLALPEIDRVLAPPQPRAIVAVVKHSCLLILVVSLVFQGSFFILHV
jgi:hypothetical protein